MFWYVILLILHIVNNFFLNLLLYSICTNTFSKYREVVYKNI
jgi:hypothetical protein